MPFAPIVEALSTAQQVPTGYAPTAANDGARLGQKLGVALGEGRGGAKVINQSINQSANKQNKGTQKMSYTDFSVENDILTLSVWQDEYTSGHVAADAAAAPVVCLHRVDRTGGYAIPASAMPEEAEIILEEAERRGSLTITGKLAVKGGRWGRISRDRSNGPETWKPID
jgi:hypothetical protein